MTVKDAILARIRRILASQSLDEERRKIDWMLDELNIELIDYAAALLHLQESEKTVPPQTVAGIVPSNRIRLPKMVRYRLAVGSDHAVSPEDIKDILVEESGVDRKLITFIDMRHHHTIVELPEGMPDDIFHHLKAIEIKQQKLDIRRIAHHAPRHRIKNGHRRKKHTQRSDQKRSA